MHLTEEKNNLFDTFAGLDYLKNAFFVKKKLSQKKSKSNLHKEKMS